MKSAIKHMLHMGLAAAAVVLMTGCDGRQSAQEPFELKPTEEITVREDVLLELSEKEGKLCLIVTNQGQETLKQGNSGSVSLQVNQDRTCYNVNANK